MWNLEGGLILLEIPPLLRSVPNHLFATFEFPRVALPCVGFVEGGFSPTSDR